MNKEVDTIAAIATPPGRGGIGILRVSGPLVSIVAKRILGRLPRPRQAEYLVFRGDGNVILDHGIALFFPRPYSFTGEDVLELQGHGGPVILDLLLQCIISLPDVRIARPGEFSERAFLNNKIDLIQAEAITDLINASSEQAVRSALNSLNGMFSKKINKLVEAITSLRVHIEAVINFPDEKINLLNEDKIKASLDEIINKLNAVFFEAKQGSMLREGMKVVIAGNPNTGKSSLLNSLARNEVAIVTSIAGTTRDVLREYIYLDGIPICIIDTAGLHNASNEVERIGIKRAWSEIKKADHVLVVVDSTTVSINDMNIFLQTFIPNLPTSMNFTVIRNKADLTGENIAIINNIKGYSLITLSAKSGAGIDLLRTHLKQNANLNSSIEGKFLARRRHLNELKTAVIHLCYGKEQFMISHNVELMAEELFLAQQALSKITGTFSSNDLLNNIFSDFCVGK